MDNPDWTQVTSAKAAVWSAALSVFSALATGGGVLVAWRALRWAKDAASAAQAQVNILELQLAQSEPQPILLLTVMYELSSGAMPLMKIENVGEEIALEVKFSPILIPSGTFEGTTMQLLPIRVVRPEANLPLDYAVMPEVNVSRSLLGVAHPQSAQFFDQLAARAVLGQNENIVVGELSNPLATVHFSYLNARGRKFDKAFMFWMREYKVVCEPENLLV